MNSIWKSVLFWFAIVVAAFAIFQYSAAQPIAPAARPTGDLAGEWILDGKADQACAIFRQGDVLMLVNERGDMATGKLEGASKVVVLKGNGWEPGLTAELKDGGKTLAWRDGSVWTRR